MAAPLLPDKEGDWIYIQAQYELGEKAPQLIARETGVPISKIFAMAARNEWIHPADNSTAAQMRAEVRIAAEVRQRQLVETEKAEVIRVNADMQYRMLQEHRTDISKARSLANRMMNELTEITAFAPELKDLGTILRSPDGRGRDKENDIYQSILGFTDRVKNLKTLTDAMRNLILLERQAYGVATMIEDPEKPQEANTSDPVMAAIMSKFDLVLQEKKSPSATPMADVIENGSSSTG